MADIFEKNAKTSFLTLGHMGPPLKIKIGLRSDLSWPKVGLEPKYHEPGAFGGFGKREQTNTHTHKIHVL